MLKGKTPLVIAVALGLLAGIVSYSAIKRQERLVRIGWNLIPVIVAANDIPEGSTVTYEAVAQRPIPEQFVTSSVIKPDSVSYVVGQKVLVPIQAGDPLLWSQFETSKATEHLSTVIQKKARAVTLAVGERQSVGGWVRPNDHVDIIGTFRDPGSGEQVATTLLQNVIVVATGKLTGTTNLNLVPESARDYHNITVLLLPEEAELMTLGQELGQLTFTLRNSDDIDILNQHGRAGIQTLLTGQRLFDLGKERRHLISEIRGRVETHVPGGIAGRHGTDTGADTE